VFKVASQLDHSFTVKNQQTKYMLRKAMEGIIPTSVLERKKLGFPVTIRHWLRNELFDWTYQLIIDSQTDHLFKKIICYFYYQSIKKVIRIIVGKFG